MADGTLRAFAFALFRWLQIAVCLSPSRPTQSLSRRFNRGCCLKGPFFEVSRMIREMTVLEQYIITKQMLPTKYRSLRIMERFYLVMNQAEALGAF